MATTANPRSPMFHLALSCNAPFGVVVTVGLRSEACMTLVVFTVAGGVVAGVLLLDGTADAGVGITTGEVVKMAVPEAETVRAGPAVAVEVTSAIVAALEAW